MGLTLPRQIRDCLLSQQLIGMSRPLMIPLPKPSNLCIKHVCIVFIKHQSDIIDRTNKLNPLEEKYYLKQEKKQMIKLQDKEKMDWSAVYGVEHLFRLFVHLPKIYDNIKQMSALEASKISNYVSLFIGFLAKNIKKYVVSDFYWFLCVCYCYELIFKKEFEWMIK